MKELTKAEEQVMQILWRLKKAFVKEIIQEMDDPKPAYNTVSTIVRILEKKELVAYEAFGKTHRYYPLVSKTDYSKFYMKSMLGGYFSNSYKQLVSFFTKQEGLSIQEMEEIKQMLDVEIANRKGEKHE